MSRQADHDSTSFLDGLRGFAALIVVASHASGMGLFFLPGVDLTGIGKYGVYLFFVLSAYLLSAQWLTREQGPQVDTKEYLGRYLLRRFLRIYPLYTLVLLTGLALPPHGLGVPLDGAAVLRHLSLLEGRDIYWSIPVEFAYYLVIPMLCLWLGVRRLVWPIRGAGVLVAALLIQYWFPADQAPFNSSNPMYYLPVLLCGSLAAWWQVEFSAQGAGRNLRMLPDAVVMVLLVLTVPAVLMGLGWTDRVDALHRAFLFWGLTWSALLLALLHGWLPGWRKLFGTRAMRQCGRWSFSIYLLHIPALYLAKRLPIPVATKAWAALAITLVVAAFAYRLIERPTMRLGR